MALFVDLVALSNGLHGSLRGFSGSEQWIAWLCPNGFSGSIFMDWVAPPPWNTQTISIQTLVVLLLIELIRRK